jgi:murein DD-endopeptidase MepM/ murein hydrolase activator NlpD
MTRILFIFAIMVFCGETFCDAQQGVKPCNFFGDFDTCPNNQVCVANGAGPSFKGDGTCYSVPLNNPVQNLILPFDNQTEAICTHSSGKGSHSTWNSFNALDLATPYDKPAAVVRAAGDGQAFVLLGADGKLCPTPQGPPSAAIYDPASNNCGDGWGNHMHILHSNGFYTRYVHLEKVLISDGQYVKQGDPIGIEGMTGAAGHRHLHFSLNRANGTTLAEWEKDVREAVGQSMPFEFRVKQNGVIQFVNAANLNCPPRKIGEVPSFIQPHLFGVFETK